MNYTIRRAFAAATVTVAVGAGGFAAPASAHHSDLGCDPVVVAAAVDAATTEARAAQKLYTVHTRTSMQTLMKKLKAHERAEAKAADKRADRLAVKAVSSTGEAREEAQAAAKDARTVARAEAKEARRIDRASLATLRKAVKADRKVLKAQWDAAKATLRDIRVHADTCDEAPIEPPTTGDPVD